MKKLFTFFLLSLSFLASAQNPGDLAQSFGPSPGFNGSVSTIEVQADGKILLGGDFTTYMGATENYMIRLNADGSKDPSFSTGTGFDNSVSTIAVQADGKILVGGNFTSYKGVTDNRIIRLNADGSKDTSFSTGTGFNGGGVYTIALQADGKILLGGDFTTYKGATENYMIRLNADGSKDPSFSTGTGFNSYVRTIALQADGKILLGGYFTTYNGITENRIIRLNADGSKDNTFSTGTGFNSYVRTIALQADGKILVGGDFTTYNGVTENGIIRLNADGSKDTTFSTGTGFDGYVNTIAVQANGKKLVGGYLTSYNGITENRIIRLNADGSKDSSFSTGTGFENFVFSNSSVFTIAVQADGKILVGGHFYNYNGVTENDIIRLNADGSKNPSFSTGTGFNSSVFTIAVQTDGKMLVGGLFTSYKEVAEHRLIRLNSDGSKDPSFSTGTGFNDQVRTIAVQADGKILVGGDFTRYNGVTENGIIRLNSDGSKDSSFTTGTGFDSRVQPIAVQADGKILVGGYFITYNGVTENRIIRLNADGSKDSSFSTGTGFDSVVYTIAVQADGKILVGGWFTTYNGVTKNRIIRLNSDGSKDSSFSTETVFNAGVLTIAVQADGKILFTTLGNITNYMIRLNTDGSKDSSFSTGTGFNSGVNTFAVQADGKILAGGYFTTYNGVTAKYIIRLNADGSKDPSFGTGSGFNALVLTMAVQAGGKILIGGSFTTYKDDNSSAYLIGLHTTEVGLGTERFDTSNSFVVYPNPVKDVLYFQSNDLSSLKNIKIYDFKGKLVLEDTKENISVGSLSKGLYLAKITTDKGEITRKFVKE